MLHSLSFAIIDSICPAFVLITFGLVQFYTYTYLYTLLISIDYTLDNGITGIMQFVQCFPVISSAGSDLCIGMCDAPSIALLSIVTLLKNFQCFHFLQIAILNQTRFEADFATKK